MEYSYPVPNRMATNLLANRVKLSERRNEMLGLGLLGTIIVVLVIVWLIRRV